MVGPWFIDTFAEGTGLPALDYAILMPPVETCVERVATRREHGFRDEPATRKMYDEFAAAAVDPRHVFVEPAGTAEQVAALVAAAWEAGRLAR
jgi:hypothetical protein